MIARVLLAILLPFLALALQWLLWPWIDPFVWFLFFPTIFFSARLGGLWAGLASTVLSTGIVWFFFIPPKLSWLVSKPLNLYSVGLFLVMGYLFSDTQERLRRAQRKNEEALTETRAANEKTTQLYQKTLELDELKSQFFANVSHELRTPLTLIMSPLTRRLSFAGLPEEQRREDEMILRNARILYRHVSDLLDAAKLESGHMAIEYTRIDLGGLTRAMASHFDSLAQEKGIDYCIDVLTPLEAEADGEKVQRILFNLLSNAFKFTPEGGRIHVRLHESMNQAIISIEDNGPGVPDNLREAVFERFRQVEGTTQRRFGGTGLGLSIVKEFAELHGGSASLAEAPEGGALFIVRLPLYAPAGTVIQSIPSRLDPVIDHQAVDELRTPARDPAIPADVQAGGKAPLVLVVEDNVDMNAFIANFLRTHYRVVCAFDGREGLEQALALQPDLILSDVMMPHLSGDQMVAELRRQPNLTEVPIVMLTAKADDELRVRLLKAGVQDYINKPFALEELLARVDRLINERRRTQAELQRYKQIVTTSGDMLAFVDNERRFLVANWAYADLFGVTPADLLQRYVVDILGTALYASIAPHLDRALAGEFQRFIIEPTFPDGKRRVLDADFRPFRKYGEVEGIVVKLCDITELKMTEEALKASESSLKAAQHQARIGNWEWNIQTGTQTWSEEIYHIYGRDPALPPATYLEVQQYFSQESWTRLAAEVEKCLAKGDSYQCDAEVSRPDGTHRWIVARGEAVRDADGNVIILHGTVQDITERKRAEQALRESEEQLAGIVNSAMDALITIDEQQRIRLFNPAAGQMFGLSAAEAIGQHLGRLIPKRFRHAHEDHIRNFGLTSTTSRRMGELGEISGLRNNGEEFPIEASISQSSINSGKLFTVILRDITERKQSEEGIRKSQAQLNTFIQHAPISIAMFDRNMNYLATSGRFLLEYGRGYTDLTGRNHYQVNPDMPIEWKQIHQQGLAGATLENDEDLWLQADGSKHWLRWAVLPWTNEKGAIGGIIISTEDITDRKLAEEEIRRLNANLEQLVAERTAELTAANRELDAFAYAVSHDLRAPLRAMCGFSQALIEDYGEGLCAEAIIYLEQIDLAGRKMSELIDGLLTLSRSTRGELHLDIVDLSNLSERLLAELMQNDPGRQMVVQVTPGLQVHGDARMIEVIMRNLLDNAWKYTVHTAVPSIRVYSEEQNGERRFCVADNGAGFDMAHTDKMFQPFQRLHRQDEFPGIGIGLATVQRIVHRHGGNIEAHGKPGKGAVFCFALPDMPADAMQAENEA